MEARPAAGLITPDGHVGGESAAGLGPNAPGSAGEAVARFLLGYVPGSNHVARRLTRCPRLRIVRPLIDPAYAIVHGDTYEALDYHPMRFSPPQAPVRRVTDAEAPFPELEWLHALALAAGDPARPSLLGTPLAARPMF